MTKSTNSPSTISLSTRPATRRLSRNQMAARGLSSNRIDQYAVEVIKIATRIASRYTHNDADRDDVVGRVLEHFSRSATKYMAAYATPAQYVNGTIWTRYQDFLRAERRQSGTGSLVVLEDGSKALSRRRVSLTITSADGEEEDRPISDGIDAFAAVDVRVDVGRVSDEVPQNCRQAIFDVVVCDEKAVVIARNEGVAHTTIAHRVKQGRKAFTALLGSDY